MGASNMKCTRKHTKHSVENVKTTRGSKPFALCNPLAPVRSKHDLLQIFAATPYVFVTMCACNQNKLEQTQVDLEAGLRGARHLPHAAPRGRVGLAPGLRKAASRGERPQADRSC